MAHLHPDEVLLNQDEGCARRYAACEHYAGDEKKLRKAFDLQVKYCGRFDVTADLEDGAASGEERQACAKVAQILSDARPEGFRAGCRVHPVESRFFLDDLNALFFSAARLDYITLPKVSGIAQLMHAISVINELHKKAAKPKPPAIEVLIEDEQALHEVYSIAAQPEVGLIAFGQMDFTSSHRGAIGAWAMKSPGQFDHPLMRRAKLEISAACHAHAKTPTHNPTTDYASAHQAKDDALRARHEFGFLRMWSIHPGQLGQILAAFEPSAKELEDASRILLAAQRAAWGPIADEGLLHDRASYRYYWDLLKAARSDGKEIPRQAGEAFFKI